jgi:hypothetical protein
MMRYSAIVCLLGCVMLAAAAMAGPPQGYSCVYNEEFNGNSILDTTFGYQWTGYPGVAGTVEGVSVGGGYLTLTTYSTNVGGNLQHWGGCVATKNYNGGDRQWTYGYLEARIKFSNDPGNCMAFWLVSDRMFDANPPTTGAPGNEVDIIEHRQTDGSNNNIPNSVHMAIHWGGYGSSHRQLSETKTVSSLEDNFHTFALLWTPEGYNFYVDDVQRWYYPSLLQPEWWYRALSHGPEWIILQTNPSGGWCGDLPAGGYGSLETSATKMVVDYVRVYQMAVPEPSAFAMFAAGLFGLAAYAWRKRSKIKM